TFTSTGTPASFLHPVDSLHGDLGLVGRDDVALLLSRSGASDELFGLVGQLKRLGVPIIALTGDPDSVIARQCDVALDASVAEEACAETLAPTTSTTAALALGDALAVTLLEVKGFRREDFAALHPGGTLGRNLLLRVADVMLDRDVPTLGPERPMRECVVLLAEKRGTVAVVDGAGSLVGVVTAGDLTRLMERTDQFLDIPVGDVMTRTPKTTTPDVLAGAAVQVMEHHGIMALPVLDGGRRVAERPYPVLRPAGSTDLDPHVARGDVSLADRRHGSARARGRRAHRQRDLTDGGDSLQSVEKPSQFGPNIRLRRAGWAAHHRAGVHVRSGLQGRDGDQACWK